MKLILTMEDTTVNTTLNSFLQENKIKDPEDAVIREAMVSGQTWIGGAVPKWTLRRAEPTSEVTDIRRKYLLYALRKSFHYWMPSAATEEWLADPADKEKLEKICWFTDMEINETERSDTPAWHMVNAAHDLASSLKTTDEAKIEEAYQQSADILIHFYLIADKNEFRFDFIRSVSDDDLKTTHPDFVDYATQEYFSRKSRHRH